MEEKKDKSPFKFYFFGFGIPLLLLVFWAGKDTVQLVSHALKIRRLKASIALLARDQNALGKEIALLKKNDPTAWNEFLRRHHALKPTEVEYRFKP